MKSIGQIAYEACFSSQKKNHDHFNYPRKWDEIAAAVERAVGLKLKQELRAAKRETARVWKALSPACNRGQFKGLGLYKICMIGTYKKCTRRTCLLLKARVKK